MLKVLGVKVNSFMKPREEIVLLKSEINKTIEIIKQIEIFYKSFSQKEFTSIGRTEISAIVIAQIIENFYTAVETLFLRLSQFFENNLNREKWHKDLLDKMVLQIDGVRDAVISEQSFSELLELMRFRHFKRYYFELKYDWDKLDFLIKKLESQFVKIPDELKKFNLFLDKLK
jgi:HepT-like protein